MYSQRDEEAVIVAYFAGKPAARFLDIGAHDGVRLSNTRRLWELGWTGTLVEPSPAAFSALMDNYRYRGASDYALVHAAITSTPGLVKFYDSRGDFVSTSDEAHRAVWAAPGGDGRVGVDFQPIYVAGITIEDLLRVAPGPYAFVNIDVEGANFELFREVMLCTRALDAQMICVEYQDRLTEIEDLARVRGFRRVHVTPENAIFVTVK